MLDEQPEGFMELFVFSESSVGVVESHSPASANLVRERAQRKKNKMTRYRVLRRFEFFIQS